MRAIVERLLCLRRGVLLYVYDQIPHGALPIGCAQHLGPHIRAGLRKDGIDITQNARHIGVGVQDAMRPAGQRQRHRREVHGTHSASRIDKSRQHGGHLDTNHGLRLRGGPRDVGRENDIIEPLKRRLEPGAVRLGFLREDIHGGATKPTGAQGGGERVEVDDLPASEVEQKRAGLHLLDLLGGDHVLRRRGVGHVQRHEIRRGKQLPNRLQRDRVPQRQLRYNIIEHHRHPQGLGHD
mmetsp:Transcript_29500/g.74117  ORF Transcript_29500/g.74117 Transcript_29500/m.74117 type:complete len:238 (+) Transcript_29500:462-1175(+)